MEKYLVEYYEWNLFFKVNVGVQVGVRNCFKTIFRIFFKEKKLLILINQLYLVIHYDD